MRPISLFLGFSLALALARASFAAPGDDAEAHYQALLAADKAAAPGVDWQELRLAYAARPGFKALTPNPAKRQMFEALAKPDCAAALSAAQAVIAATYVDADAHFVAAYCEETAGNTAAAKLDRDIGTGLVRSIESGDGLTPAGAFTPIDIDEEYTVMRSLGLKVTQQALIQENGHSYDALTAVDAKGQATTYYFLVDRVLAAEAAEMTPGAVSEGGPPDRTP